MFIIEEGEVGEEEEEVDVGQVGREEEVQEASWTLLVPGSSCSGGWVVSILAFLVICCAALLNFAAYLLAVVLLPSFEPL